MPIIKVGTNIGETLEGDGDHDILKGKGGADILIGHGGNDILDGGANGDTMIGGIGDDIYYVDNATDVVTENAGEGTDWVYSKMSNYTLAANVEHLYLNGTGMQNGTGNGLDNHIIGNAWSNVLSGLGGNDTLDGGFGADTMTGGIGDDTYWVDNALDVVTENAGEGTADEVRSTINYALGANVERLRLEGSANLVGVGNGLDNRLAGNAGNNTLKGGGGDDRLDGAGGADILVGGTGDDDYIIDQLDDVIIENADGGDDTVLVYGGFSYTLGANLENLNLQYSDGALNGTGNDLDNIIWGNSNSNTLIGGDGDDSLDGGLDTLNGSDGTDTLVGGLGDDHYHVDNAGDVIIENADEGEDTVYASASYTLGANLEDLWLFGAINGAGNDLDNHIWGSSSANVINGGGGDDEIEGLGGLDTLAGGEGDDWFRIVNAGAVVVENAGEGLDTVQSIVSYTLGANIEILRLEQGAGAINGTGNDEDNEIYGNSSVNVLTGGGGDDTLDGYNGIDTFIGGTGDDTFLVNHTDEVVVENANEGFDTVVSSKSYTLSAHVEALVLTSYAAAASGTGNGGDNQITGNDWDNVLAGGGGSDTLDGGLGHDTLDGGIGADEMHGGDGNDHYYLDAAGDVVVEGSNGGTDWVHVTFNNYVLTTNVENGAVNTTGGRTLTGNGLDNVLAGNVGNDVLIGAGGNDRLQYLGGLDTLSGGIGADTADFSGFGSGVWVDLTFAAGLEAWTSNTPVVGTGTYVEIADLDGIENIIGTSGADRIWGNDGDNVYGFTGNVPGVVDQFDGRGGNDTVDFSGFGAAVWVDLDFAGTEAWTQGGPLVTSDDWAQIADLANVESVVGSVYHDELYGSSGANRFDGGYGCDILEGGAGADTFVFSTPLNAVQNVDFILDFDPAEDMIHLLHPVFAAAIGGTLDAAELHVGNAAAAADDRIIYDAATGSLYFDADGTGATAAVWFAALGTGLNVTENNFLLV